MSTGQQWTGDGDNEGCLVGNGRDVVEELALNPNPYALDGLTSPSVEEIDDGVGKDSFLAASDVGGNQLVVHLRVF